VLGRDGSGPSPAAGLAALQEAAETGQLLQAVFTEVCSGSGNAARSVDPSASLPPAPFPLLPAQMMPACRPLNPLVLRFLQHPMVAMGACLLIGQFATWFGRSAAPAHGGPSPLPGALQLLLHCLALPAAWHHAAQAFRNLCVRCAALLSEPSTLKGGLKSSSSFLCP
jgi:hypothetical protein